MYTCTRLILSSRLNQNLINRRSFIFSKSSSSSVNLSVRRRRSVSGEESVVLDHIRETNDRRILLFRTTARNLVGDVALQTKIGFHRQPHLHFPPPPTPEGNVVRRWSSRYIQQRADVFGRSFGRSVCRSVGLSPVDRSVGRSVGWPVGRSSLRSVG